MTGRYSIETSTREKVSADFGGRRGRNRRGAPAVETQPAGSSSGCVSAAVGSSDPGKGRDPRHRPSDPPHRPRPRVRPRRPPRPPPPLVSAMVPRSRSMTSRSPDRRPRGRCRTRRRRRPGRCRRRRRAGGRARPPRLRRHRPPRHARDSRSAPRCEGRGRRGRTGRADDGARRLESKREDADQEVTCRGQLLIGHARVTHPLKLGDRVDDEPGR